MPPGCLRCRILEDEASSVGARSSSVGAGGVASCDDGDSLSFALFNDSVTLMSSTVSCIVLSTLWHELIVKEMNTTGRSESVFMRANLFRLCRAAISRWEEFDNLWYLGHRKFRSVGSPSRQDITEAGTPRNRKFFHTKSQSKMTFLRSVPGTTKIDYLKFTSYFALIGSLPTRYSSLSLPDSSSIIWLLWQTYVWARVMMRIL
jgi:hypothetical protein